MLDTSWVYSGWELSVHRQLWGGVVVVIPPQSCLFTQGAHVYWVWWWTMARHKAGSSTVCFYTTQLWQQKPHGWLVSAFSLSFLSCSVISFWGSLSQPGLRSTDGQDIISAAEKQTGSSPAQNQPCLGSFTWRMLRIHQLAISERQIGFCWREHSNWQNNIPWIFLSLLHNGTARLYVATKNYPQ